MKTATLLPAIFTIVCVGCYESPEASVDKGGFTFDFKAASDARFKREAAVGNLAEGTEGWRDGYCYMHNAKIGASDPRRNEVRKAVRWSKDNGELVIEKLPKLVEVCGDTSVAESVSGGFSRTVALPDASGGVYRVSFNYRMKHDVGHFGGLLLLPRLSKDAAAPRDGKAAPKAPGLQVYTLPDLWSEDGMWVKDIRIPAGCDRVELTARIDGVGELRVSDFAFTRIKYDTSVTVLFSPAAYIDNTYAFQSGRSGLVCMNWRKNDGTKYRSSDIGFELVAPAGYTLIEAVMSDTNGVTQSAGPNGSTIYRMKANSYGGGVPPLDFQGWSMLSALMRADENAPRGEMTFTVFCKGVRISNVARMDVFTVPKFSATQPKRYCNGLYTGGPYCTFKSRAAREAFSDIFTSAGATWVVNAHESTDVYAIWRKKGIRFITPEWYMCANGFRVGDGKGRPDDEKYVTPATDRPDYSFATCPVAVYEEKSYFREKFVPHITKYLEGADGLWANWEPYYFAGRGCFCDNCCREFAKWMKVPFEEMKKDWPGCLKWGEKYGKDVLKFRSWQHGRLVRTINRHIIAATGGARSLGFIPGIAWCEMSSGWRPLNLAPEVQAIDYAGSLRWIDPWGPYPWWSAGAPYVEKPADLLSYWCAAKDVREQVNKDYKEGSRPKLLALPHGFQGADAICQPEGIALAFDTFFFNGWEAAAAYTFPKGYDARWWRAFAESSERAARYENAVFDGTRVDGKVSLHPDEGYPAPASKVASKYLSWTTDVPYLQCAAYDYAGKRVCAVVNFAHSDVARFTLKAAGLVPGRYEVVSEDGATWPKSKVSRTFSAAELEGAGVRLAVGALRTKVFEIRSAR